MGQLGGAGTHASSVALADIRPLLEDLYRDLHAHPELSFAEYRTARVVSRWLREAGCEIQEGIGGTGVVGVLRNGNGPCVLLRADMDALPVTEDTGLSYAAVSDPLAHPTAGVMHACGHDLHMSALAGAMVLLAGSKPSWSGTVVAVFQPAEETAAGALAMLRDGLVGRVPRPDVAFAQHVFPFPAGQLRVQAGAALAMGESMKVTVYGRGAHGSRPHLGVDPILLASAIVLRLQGIVARELAPGTPAVVTVGSLQAGTRSGIIPDRATLLIDLRAYDRAVRDRLVSAVQRIVRAECRASGTPRRPSFELYDQFPLTENDPLVTERVRAAFVAEFGADAVGELGRLIGSEDFSHLPDAFGTPYTYWGIGGIDPRVYATASVDGVLRNLPANHSPAFAPPLQPTLDTAVRALHAAARAYLR